MAQDQILCMEQILEKLLLNRNPGSLGSKHKCLRRPVFIHAGNITRDIKSCSYDASMCNTARLVQVMLDKTVKNIYFNRFHLHSIWRCNSAEGEKGVTLYHASVT